MKKKSILILLALAAICTGCGTSNSNNIEKDNVISDDSKISDSQEQIVETKIDPFAEVTVSAIGYEPYVKLSFDYDDLNVIYLKTSFELENPDSIIKNGDSVTVNFIYSDEYAAKHGYVFSPLSKDYIIETDGYYVTTSDQFSNSIYEEINSQLLADIEKDYTSSSSTYVSLQRTARPDEYPFNTDITYETNVQCSYVYIGSTDPKDESAEIKSKIYLIYEIQCKDSAIGDSSIYLSYSIDNMTVLYPEEVQMPEASLLRIDSNLDDAKKYINAEIDSTYHSMSFTEKKDL